MGSHAGEQRPNEPLNLAPVDSVLLREEMGMLGLVVETLAQLHISQLISPLSFVSISRQHRCQVPPMLNSITCVPSTCSMSSRYPYTSISATLQCQQSCRRSIPCSHMIIYSPNLPLQTHSAWK